MEAIYWQIGTSILFGGLAGATANILFAKWTQRIERSFKLIDYYLSIRPEIASVKTFLLDPASLKTPANLNSVKKIGDWFNFIAAICEQKMLTLSS